MDIESGDYTLTPCGHLGGKVSVSQDGKHLNEFVEVEDALKFVSEHMEEEKFYSNIWWISDHGNGWMIDKDGNELERCEKMMVGKMIGKAPPTRVRTVPQI